MRAVPRCQLTQDAERRLVMNVKSTAGLLAAVEKPLLGPASVSNEYGDISSQKTLE